MIDVTIWGKSFKVHPVPADFWGWVTGGRYDSEWKVLAEHLRPEHTFIDLGAWVGSHSLFAFSIVSRVIAVEPDPVAFAILEKNAAGIEITRVAVGNEGIITLGSGLLGASTTRANRDAGSGIGLWQPDQQFEIECITLRSLVAKHNISDPMFLKIDVEGSEEQILQDVEFFEEHRPTMFLETHSFWWRNEAKVWETIRQIGKLYKRTLDINGSPIDLSSVYPRHVVFTNQEVE